MGKLRQTIVGGGRLTTKGKDQIAIVAAVVAAGDEEDNEEEKKKEKKEKKIQSDLTHPPRLTRANAPNAAKTQAPSSLTYSLFPPTSSPGPITPRPNPSQFLPPLSKNTPHQLPAIVDSVPIVAAA